MPTLATKSTVLWQIARNFHSSFIISMQGEIIVIAVCLKQTYRISSLFKPICLVVTYSMFFLRGAFAPKLSGLCACKTRAHPRVQRSSGRGCQQEYFKTPATGRVACTRSHDRISKRMNLPPQIYSFLSLDQVALLSLPPVLRSARCLRPSRSREPTSLIPPGGARMTPGEG